MILPVWGTNATPRALVVDKIHGELRFTPPDGWELAGFQAQAFGVKMILGGSVTNASEIRKLKLSRTRPANDKSAAAFWYDFLAKLEESHFEAPAEIAGNIDGDAKKARLQHPLGVAFYEGKLYVADTYNNKIRVVDPLAGGATSLLGNGLAEFKDGRGRDARFDEPGGLSAAEGKLYIADTNNHAIRVADLSNGEVSTFVFKGLK